MFLNKTIGFFDRGFTFVSGGGASSSSSVHRCCFHSAPPPSGPPESHGPARPGKPGLGRAAPLSRQHLFVEQNFLFSFPSFLSCLLMATPGRSLNPIWDYFSRDETTAKYTKAFCKGLPWPLGRREFIPMFLYRPLH